MQKNDYPKDTLYESPQSSIKPFVFDTHVTKVFADMINRSVPGYQTVLEMLGVITREYAMPESKLYDLGCSRGSSSLAIYNNIMVTDTQLVSIDSSQSMVAATKELFTPLDNDIAVKILCQDIRETKLHEASLVCLNLTLQFIPASERLSLIKKCYKALLPGGVIVLFEKVVSSKTDQETVRNKLHYGFKQANGYSSLEISQKRTALEKTLIPETDQQHYDRLKQAGFKTVEQFFHCLNFSAFLAIKEPAAEEVLLDCGNPCLDKCKSS